jgi:hypothetical protein
MQRLSIIVDNFHPDPDSVRRRALNMEFVRDEDFVGWRTQRYQPTGIKKLIEQRMRCRIKRWEDDKTGNEHYSGAFFSGFDTGSYAQKIWVHYDVPISWVTLLIYMTPAAPPDAGISMWQHRATGLIACPTQHDAARLKVPVGKLKEILARDADRSNRWREIDRIGNVYNRAVMFTSGLLHSASAHFGSDKFNGRIFQAFRFSIDERSDL